MPPPVPSKARAHALNAAREAKNALEAVRNARWDARDARKRARAKLADARKRAAEIKDLEEVERRAAKIARHIGGGSDVGGGGGDEIDIDDDDETEIKDVETKAIPAAVLGGLATKG